MTEKRKLAVPPRDYQPSKAELEEEYEMPGADMDTLRKAFFRPVEVTKGGSSREHAQD